MPSIGRLRDRIDILKRTEVADVNGTSKETYKTVKTVFAQIKAKGLTEQLNGGQVNEKTTHIFVIRTDTSITSEKWLRFRGGIFAIRSIMQTDFQNRWTELHCEQKTV